MTPRQLEPKARVALALQALYAAAEALCNIFVAVYLWINSHDFMLVCGHYLAQYTLIPIFFVLAGWASQRFDRVWVYRLGLVLNAVYYGLFLLLREEAANYAYLLGGLLGITWGVFYAGANTFNYDVTAPGRREYYVGLLHSVVGGSRLLAPVLGGWIIATTPDKLTGYHTVFGAALVMYLLCFALSFKMSPDNERRPFRIRRALFPGKDQRDWRYIMVASGTQAGVYNIFSFLLGLVMFMLTENELIVGGYGSLQGFFGVVSAMIMGRLVIPKNRKPWMFRSMVLLIGGGLLLSIELTVVTLLAFGVIRAIAGSMFAICNFSLRMDIISDSVQEPWERIEYLCAWEVPLAIGRIIMILTFMGLHTWLDGDARALQTGILILCCLRILTYSLVTRTSHITRYAEA